MIITETDHLSTRTLNRMVILLTMILLICISVFSWHSWRAEKAMRLHELESLMELGEKSIDSYFMQTGNNLIGLGQELLTICDHTPLDPAFFDHAFVLISRFRKLHSGLYNVSLLREDGKTLLNGNIPYSPDLPTFANEPSFIRFREETRTEAEQLNIGQPLISAVGKRWIIPLRQEIRNREGKTVFILSATMLVDVLENFWKEAPFTQTSSLGLMRDDGFLISRYPAPPNMDLHEIFDKPRTGAIITHLKKERFPDHGYLEGTSSLDGVNYLQAFRRLEHFPLTLFVAIPMPYIHAEWWNKVKIPFIMLAFVFIGGCFIYHRTFLMQRKWEEELKSSKAFLDNVIENSPVSLWISDDKGTLLRTNQALRDLYPLSDDEVVGKYNLLDDNLIEQQGFMPLVRETLEKGSTIHFEIDYDTSLNHNLILANTKHMILDVTMSAVMGSDGKVTNVIIQEMDITKQKQTERRITKLNRDFVAFLEKTTDLVYYKDNNSCYCFCSQALANMTGHNSWRDIIGKCTLDVFPEKTAPIYYEEDMSVFREGTALLNKIDPYYDRSGATGWFNTSKWPQFDHDGKADGLFGISRIITEQIEMEEKLTELNRDFVAFLESTSDFVFYKDKNSCFRFASQFMANLTGHACWRDMIGKCTLDVYRKELAQIYYEEDMLIFSNGKPRQNIVNPSYDASGNDIWLNTSKWPLWNAEGEIVGLFGIGRDVTKEKLLEDELHHANEFLEERVAQEVEKNMHQERMLIHQSRMAAMGEMLGNIAHQWKQPLNSLNILFFNIKDAFEFNELNQAYIDQAVADGKRLVEKMSTTVTDFRNFFRPDKEIKAFSAMDQIRQAIVLVQANFDKNDISIHIDAPQDLTLTGFPNEYSHVLLNLFSNAYDAILAHYHPLSGRVVDIVLSEKDGQGCVAVRDTGGGIPEEILDRIFDPYFTTKEKGSGIGLYMSKMIISRMNGSITAKNIEGGTEFSLCVPLAKMLT